MAEASKIRLDRHPMPENSLRMKVAGFWDILVDAVNNYSNNGDTNQAAAIALYAILSAIPLFILTVIAAGYMFSTHPNVQADITNAIKGFQPYFSEKLLAQLGQIESKKHLLGWIGLLGLVWLSAAIFNSIESALNIIFRSKEKRNYVFSKLLAIAMIPLGWLIAGISMAISYLAVLLAQKPLILPGGMEISLTFASGIILRYVLPYLISVLFFTFVYRIIPTTKIHSSVAVAGGAVFALLVEIAKQFFTWYIAHYTHYDVIFGSLETVVILVIWVFYVALIFLFCAEIMSSYQRRDILLLERAMLKPHRSHLKVDERLFQKFGHAYEKGSIIFNEGDSGHEMFYILSGRVCLERVNCQVKKTLAEMGPGQYFGEMAALIDISRSATARALEDSHVAIIDTATFRNLMRESQEVGLHMLREFSARLKNSNAALEEFTNLWTRVVIIIHFLDHPRAPIEEHLPVIGGLTQKDPVEIRELINDLNRLGVLITQGDTLTNVVREKMWAILDSGTLKKCFLEDENKV